MSNDIEWTQRNTEANLRAVVGWWEGRFPCDRGCSDAPEEDCSRHGRKPAELWGIIEDVSKDRATLRAKVARVEALFSGGPDAPCRTAWDGEIECVSVPLADLNVALDGTS